MIHSSTKKFLEDHIDLLDGTEAELKEFCLLYSKYHCGYVPGRQLYDEILPDAGINLDKYRWEVFDDNFIEKLDYEKHSPYNRVLKSNSWSRLQYLLSSLDEHYFSYDEIVQHCLENQSKLQINMEKIPYGCGWESDNDYDLGWFNEDGHPSFRQALNLLLVFS